MRPSPLVSVCPVFLRMPVTGFRATRSPGWSHLEILNYICKNPTSKVAPFTGAGVRNGYILWGPPFTPQHTLHFCIFPGFILFPHWELNPSRWKVGWWRPCPQRGIFWAGTQVGWLPALSASGATAGRAAGWWTAWVVLPPAGQLRDPARLWAEAALASLPASRQPFPPSPAGGAVVPAVGWSSV